MGSRDAYARAMGRNRGAAVEMMVAVFAGRSRIRQQGQPQHANHDDLSDHWRLPRRLHG
jgi:hypothetical protein